MKTQGKRPPGIDKVIRSYVKNLQVRARELEAALRELSPRHPLLNNKKDR